MQPHDFMEGDQSDQLMGLNCCLPFLGQGEVTQVRDKFSFLEFVFERFLKALLIWANTEEPYNRY